MDLSALKSMTLIVIILFQSTLYAQTEMSNLIEELPRDSTVSRYPEHINNKQEEDLENINIDVTLFLNEVDKDERTNDTLQISTSKMTDETTNKNFNQDSVIVGVIQNSDHQEPMMGVKVSYLKNTLSTLTNVDGQYEMPYFENDTLVFSISGEERLRLASNDPTLMSIHLGSVRTEQIKEVVVTAMGIERDTRTLSYDLQKIDGALVAEVKDPSGNLMSQLNGKVPGLVTTTASGGPGSPTRILLRGNRSISGNNNALIVIDGVPVDNSFGTQPSDENGGYVGLDGSVSINADDIDNINILKGPSAAALYGGSAANGAIIINTKKGYDGPLRINYQGAFTLNQPVLHIDYQNNFGRGNNGQYSEFSGFSWGLQKNIQDKDNVASFFRNGWMLNNSVQLYGGNEELQGFASYSNSQSQGNIGNNTMDAHFINGRVRGRYLDRLELDLKVNYTNMDIKNRAKTGEIGTMLNAYIIPRDMTKEEFKNYSEVNDLGQTVPAFWPTSNPSIYTNPYWHVNRTSHNIHRNRMMILGSAKYEFMPWLNLQARYSIDYINDQTTGKFADHSVILAPSPGGQYTESVLNRTHHYADVLLTFQKYLHANWNLNANVGASLQAINSRSLAVTSNGLNIPNLFMMQNATAPATSSSQAEMMRQGVFGTFQLGFQDYWFLDATIRNDWSSTLPKPYSFAYPSIGLTSILSDKFIFPEWINYSKIRASYAKVGNDAPSYIIHQYYSFGPGAGQGYLSRDAVKAIENLKPEQTQSIEVGTEWAFLNNRLFLNASWYHTNTFNQLLSLATQPATGFSTEWVNAGNIQNRGLEIQLIVVPVRKEHLEWSSTLNFSTNKSKVISLTPELTKTKISGSERLAIINIEEGRPFGEIYGQAWKKDNQGNYIVDQDGLPIIEDNQRVGNFNPDFMLGWLNQIHWKGFNFSFQIDGRIGGQVVSGTDAYLGYYGLASYTENHREGGWILDAVNEQGERNNVGISSEQFWTTVSGGRTAWTEFFTYDATNFRLRNVVLSYTLPWEIKWVDKIELGLYAQNLFFFYRGKSIMDLPGVKERKIPFDPEMSLGAGNVQGIESGMPPAIRSFGFNFKVFLK